MPLMGRNDALARRRRQPPAPYGFWPVSAGEKRCLCGLLDGDGGGPSRSRDEDSEPEWREHETLVFRGPACVCNSQFATIAKRQTGRGSQGDVAPPTRSIPDFPFASFDGRDAKRARGRLQMRSGAQTDHAMTWAGLIRLCARRMATRRISWTDKRINCDEALRPSASFSGGSFLGAAWRLRGDGSRPSWRRRA